jgi:hypothetical protein
MSSRTFARPDVIETLRTQLALAEQRRADRQQAIATWERRMRDHRDHREREVRP